MNNIGKILEIQYLIVQNN